MHDQSRVQLIILIAHQFFIKLSDAIKDPSPIGSKRNCIDIALIVAQPKVGVSDTSPCTHTCCNDLADAGVTHRFDGTPCAPAVWYGLQHFDTVGNKIISNISMSIDANNDITASRINRTVHGVRHNPLGIVKHSQASVFDHESLNYLPGAVIAQPINNNDL